MDSDRQADVLLAFMPFGVPTAPSLALSLLKAGLINHDIEAQVAYYNLAFAKTIGVDLYFVLSGFPELRFLDEWIFSRSAFGYDKKIHDETLLELEKERTRVKTGKPTFLSLPEDLLEKLIQAREKAELFIATGLDPFASGFL